MLEVRTRLPVAVHEVSVLFPLLPLCREGARMTVHELHRTTKSKNKTSQCFCGETASEKCACGAMLCGQCYAGHLCLYQTIELYDDYQTAAKYAVLAALRHGDGKLLRSIKTLMDAATKDVPS